MSELAYLLSRWSVVGRFPSFVVARITLECYIELDAQTAL